MLKLLDRETNNCNFGEYDYISDLCVELIKMLKDDMGNEGIPLDEAVNYYQIKEENDKVYNVDCEYNPDKIFIVDADDYNKLIWSEYVA